MEYTTPVEALEAGWCRGAYARNEQGEAVSAKDPAAVEWCLFGAGHKAYGEDTWGHEIWLDALEELLGVDVADGWNDAPERTKDEVIALAHEAMYIVNGFWGDVP